MAEGQYLGSVDAVVDVAVVLQLLIGHGLHVAAIHPGLHQAVGVLTEARVHLHQPVGHVVRVARGVVAVGLQYAQVPQKPWRTEGG